VGTGTHLTWDEVTGEWRKFHNKELHDLYVPFAKYIRIMKSRRMRLAGHVARMGEEERIQVIGGKARRKETTRKTKT
jgi:hypothetical protein